MNHVSVFLFLELTFLSSELLGFFFPVVQINFQTILINNPDNPNFAKWNSKFLPYLSLHFKQTDLCYLKLEKTVENVFLKIPLRFTKIAARNERIQGSKEKNAAPVIWLTRLCLYLNRNTLKNKNNNHFLSWPNFAKTGIKMRCDIGGKT